MASYPYQLTLPNTATSASLAGITIVSGSLSIRSADPAPLPGTTAYIAGGSSSLSIGYQDVGIPAECHEDIDVSGSIFVNFTGYLAGFGDGDTSIFDVFALDASMTSLTSSRAPTNTTITWMRRQVLYVLPSGSRHIRVRLTSTRNQGTNNDGYFASMSLALQEDAGINITKYTTTAVLGAVPDGVSINKMTNNVVLGAVPDGISVSKMTVSVVVDTRLRFFRPAMIIN